MSSLIQTCHTIPVINIPDIIVNIAELNFAIEMSKEHVVTVHDRRHSSLNALTPSRLSPTANMMLTLFYSYCQICLQKTISPLLYPFSLRQSRPSVRVNFRSVGWGSCAEVIGSSAYAARMSVWSCSTSMSAEPRNTTEISEVARREAESWSWVKIGL